MPHSDTASSLTQKAFVQQVIQTQFGILKNGVKRVVQLTILTPKIDLEPIPEIYLSSLSNKGTLFGIGNSIAQSFSTDKIAPFQIICYPNRVSKKSSKFRKATLTQKKSNITPFDF